MLQYADGEESFLTTPRTVIAPILTKDGGIEGQQNTMCQQAAKAWHANVSSREGIVSFDKYSSQVFTHSHTHTRTP